LKKVKRSLPRGIRDKNKTIYIRAKFAEAWNQADRLIPFVEGISVSEWLSRQIQAKVKELQLRIKKDKEGLFQP